VICCAREVYALGGVTHAGNNADTRHRSEFIAEAAQEMPRRKRFIEVAHRVQGSLKDVDIPGWETPESTSERVRAQRRGLGPLPALWNNEGKKA
jgi:hypothetical protein